MRDQRYCFSQHTAPSVSLHYYIPDSVGNQKAKLTDDGFDEDYRRQQYYEAEHRGWLEWGTG